MPAEIPPTGSHRLPPLEQGPPLQLPALEQPFCRLLPPGLVRATATRMNGPILTNGNPTRTRCGCHSRYFYKSRHRKTGGFCARVGAPCGSGGIPTFDWFRSRPSSGGIPRTTSAPVGRCRGDSGITERSRRSKPDGFQPPGPRPPRCRPDSRPGKLVPWMECRGGRGTEHPALVPLQGAVRAAGMQASAVDGGIQQRAIAPMLTKLGISPGEDHLDGRPRAGRPSVETVGECPRVAMRGAQSV
ncbi:uncharacterized protein CMC5_054810 [Chondromyces crocatus]|uniref:Uncharacterized protein n=1 Tax=Chondromyces crocatus TaxID=52 RepID=A0A0K1EKX6_CHOCO|nr:uncharacterized protein CMC5_054810 [Chondromyces crocatus]